YGAQLAEGKTPAQAQAFLKELLQHTVVQPASGSDALSTFQAGKGDVLLSYESDAIAAKKDSPNDVDYLTPDDTILIQTPLAATKDAPPAAQDFVKWEYTPEAQQLWADAGYRPVNKAVFDKNRSKFTDPSNIFTIDSLGGWDKVSVDFFDPTK